MSENSFTIIAADDHPVVLSGIRLLLQGSREFRLLAEARNAATVLAAIQCEVPDLLILDQWMGESDGIELLRQVHERWPSIRILVYSMNDERSHGMRALRSGAAGYLMKSHGLDELLKALRTVASGGRYLSPEMISEMIGDRLSPNPPAARPAALAALSDREFQILRLIGTGRSIADIANDLSISKKTVGAHRENLKNKLNVENSVVLARKAIQLVENQLL